VDAFFLKNRIKRLITLAYMYKKVDPLQAIRLYFPSETFSIVEACFRDYRFNLRISKPRKNKLGSFRPDAAGNPLITVNADLGKYMFFLVFLHEIAHLVVHKQFGRQVVSHGIEWKTAFRQLVTPLIEKEQLPEELNKPLKKYFVHTAATFIRQTELMRVINRLDGKEPVSILTDIPLNTAFALANGKRFVKLEVRRTRCRCLCLDNKRYYDVACSAQIFPANDTH
jgi:SprT protein